jgi:hypothetical protein
MDRAFRIVIGLFGLAVVFVGPQTPWGLLGVIPLVTGILGRSVVYKLLRVDTLEKEVRR